MYIKLLQSLIIHSLSTVLQILLNIYNSTII